MTPSPNRTTLICGGAGFVGLAIAEQLARAGHRPVLFDQRAVPDPVWSQWPADLDRPDLIRGDVTNPTDLTRAFGAGAVDAVVYGAAITAGSKRDVAEPDRILAVNLMGLINAVQAARTAGVRRLINLSSVAALGRAMTGQTILDETLVPDPVSLYGVSKAAGERAVARIADLTGFDALSVRLSGVWGRYEHATGVRDTLSPHAQVIAALHAGTPALLERAGLRDWVHSSDVGRAVVRLLEAPRLRHRLYNVTATPTTVLAFGEALALRRSDFICRLIAADEAPTIDLHMPTDRPSLCPRRLADEFNWRAEARIENLAATLVISA